MIARPNIVPEFLDLAHAAAQYCVSRSTLKSWIKAEVLHGYRIGRKKILVRSEDLQALVTDYTPPAPMSADQLTRICETAIAEVLGPDWREQRKEELRQQRQARKQAAQTLSCKNRVFISQTVSEELLYPVAQR
jgi:hypothetical protein